MQLIGGIYKLPTMYVQCLRRILQECTLSYSLGCCSSRFIYVPIRVTYCLGIPPSYIYIYIRRYMMYTCMCTINILHIDVRKCTCEVLKMVVNTKYMYSSCTWMCGLVLQFGLTGPDTLILLGNVVHPNTHTSICNR